MMLPEIVAEDWMCRPSPPVDVMVPVPVVEMSWLMLAWSIRMP